MTGPSAEARRATPRTCAGALLASTAALASACFAPDYPTGIPCSEIQTCPPGQTCDLSVLICRAMPAPDAMAGPAPDAMAGPAPDATPQPVDPCASAPCGAGTCEAEGDRYRCACNPGYVSDDPGGGETCVDIDECAQSPDPCAPGGTCVNGENEYTCDCAAGFVFDGQTCARILFDLVGAGSADEPRQWADGTTASSCQEYRFPALPYVYEGATGDGVYRIVPPGRAEPSSVFCDMTTGGGGWTAIDPAAAAALGGVATAVRADGTINTCQVTDGLLDAFYRNGSGTRTLICQYDIDLGFSFDTVRVSDAVERPVDRLELVSMSTPGNTTDITNLLAQPWEQSVQVGGVGDVVIGSAAAVGPALSLGAALGIASTTNRQFAAGALLAWPEVDSVAVTAPGTVLRISLSESGGQEEGYRWTAGRVYVRDSRALPTQLVRP